MDALLSWGRHADPLFADYNVPRLTPADVDRWWTTQAARPGRLLFAGLLDGVLVAQMTLRDLEREPGRADFGITMDPRYVGKGLGKRFISALLGIAFSELGLERITLEVAGYNLRAVAAYGACGFVETGRTWSQLDSPVAFADLIERSAYAWLKEWVRVNGDVVRFLVIAMEARKPV